MTNELIASLQQTDSLDSERRILLSVKHAVSNENESESKSESENSPSAGSVPAPLSDWRFCLGSLRLSDDDLKFLLCHVFDRRFGWSEQHAGGVKGLASRKASLDDELKAKNQINGILDDIIQILMEERLSVTLLSGFHYAVLHAHSKPVVRNRTIIHVMDWVLMNRSDEEELPSDLFYIIKEIVVTAVVDVWSLIRNSCVVRLCHLIEFFGMDQLKDFFITLVLICQDPERGWQAREGAVMGISCVIRRFRWIGLVPDDRTSQEIPSPKPDSALKFGMEEAGVMPEFISEQMPRIVYKLLADAQLTVREHTIKAYSLYISRSKFKEVLSSFQTTISQLCQNSSSELKSSDESLTNHSCMSSSVEPHLQHQPVILNRDVLFLDAYLAEGLLGLCVHLVKHFPSGYLLSNWNSYISAFNHHIMHPASTVRQATSVIFKFIVAKNSSSPAMLRLVLRNLVSCWFPSLVDLTRDLSSSSSKQNLWSSSRISITDLKGLADEDESRMCVAWQWREGRLLAYELIFQFLIKNHWLYTFGSADQMDDETGTPSGDVTARPSCSLQCSFSGGRRERGVATVKSVGTRGRRRTQSFSAQDLIPGTRLNIAQFVHPDNVHLISRLSESEQSQLRSRESRVDSKSVHVESGRSRLTRPRYSIAVAALPGLRLSSRVQSEDSEVVDQAKNPLKQMETSLPAHRRESVSSYDAASLRLLGRRCNHLSGGGATCHAAQTSLSVKNVSLLLQCFVEDSRERSSMDETTGMELEDLRALLQMIFFQCVESLADSQWELRRMGHQLLPCVVEVIRWYDMTLLTELCDTYFTGQTTLLNYGMSLAVKYSMCHAANLMMMLCCSSHLWQDANSCRELVEKITKPVQLNVSLWCSIAAQYIERPIIDRITVVAVELLMLAVIHFDSTELSEESDKNVTAVVSVIVSIFCQANARTELAKHLSGTHWMMHKEIVPLDGFLSCCTKSETNLHFFASQVEKAVLSDIQAHLPQFCKKIEINEALTLLPLLSSYLTKCTDDDVLSKAISDSIEAISVLMSKCHLNDPVEISRKQQDIQLCLCALAGLITSKTTDQTTLQNVLHLFRNLIITFAATESSIDILLRTVVTRLKKVADTTPDPSSMTPLGRGEKKCLTYTDLTLLSNDIPSQPLELNALDTEDDEGEDDALDRSNPRVMWETQVLSSGSGSGLGGLSPRGVPPGTSTATLTTSNGVVNHQTSNDSGDSDWDNWSNGDEEDSLEVSQALQQFLREVDADLKSKGLGEMLEDGVKRLPEVDRRHVMTSIATLN